MAFRRPDRSPLRVRRGRLLTVGAQASAKKDGEALIQAGGAENICTQGSSFKVVDTTMTCDVVDDDHVELTSRRP